MATLSSFQLLGARLRVASIARAEAFYSGILGLEPAAGPKEELRLQAPGGAFPLLTLAEIPGLPPAPEDALGL